ncbi:MAG TPA: hypothetical protein VH234_05465 [Candidatus Saccharimonadales bacterium]|jgi:hypothetical protein|nr:hypothetical protein [Candidatus Saccharimonadales bacterium]
MANTPNGSPISFVNRWTEDIAKDGFTCVPNRLIKNLVALSIEPVEFVLLVAIESYRYTLEGRPRPSIDTLSKLIDRSPRHTRRMLQDLESKGFIERIRRHNKTNEYDLVPLILALNDFHLLPNASGHKRPVSTDMDDQTGGH